MSSLAFRSTLRYIAQFLVLWWHIRFQQLVQGSAISSLNSFPLLGNYHHLLEIYFNISSIVTSDVPCEQE